MGKSSYVVTNRMIAEALNLPPDVKICNIIGVTSETSRVFIEGDKVPNSLECEAEVNKVNLMGDWHYNYEWKEKKK